MDELGSWDAVETAERIRSREVSAKEVVEAAIVRAEASAHLGAVVSTTFDRAREQLARLDGAPFSGVPSFIKDLARLEGVPITWGSRGAGQYTAKRSDPSVRRIEALGFVTLGKSATPELGLTGTTEPVGSEPCRNPWAPSRSSGGSSGGAACLVASGVVPLAHASDGGGSIRIPAACCGLVGLKPTRGRFDMEGSELLPVNIAVTGVVTRTVRDQLAFFRELEVGRPPKRLPPIGPASSRPARGLRALVFTDSPSGTEVHGEHRDAARTVGKTLASLGHQVEEGPCPFSAQVIDDFLEYWRLVAWMQVVSAPITLHWRFDRSALEPWSAGLSRSFVARRAQVIAATRRLRRFAATYARAMQTWDLLVCPTTAHPPPVLGHFSAELPFETVFERLRTFLPFTPLQNSAGAPALSLPAGQSGVGTPIGVQLAAAQGKDQLLLEVAAAIEAATPWPQQAPKALWS